MRILMFAIPDESVNFEELNIGALFYWQGLRLVKTGDMEARIINTGVRWTPPNDNVFEHVRPIEEVDNI